jgi:enoyl-CoA hydratase/carnithine racemase
MGGGIGIMNGASYRAVTERTVMAMPEISIGLFPDVGATYFFNRLPPGLGLFLGLTGARFDGFDAVAAGMAEGVIRSEKKGQIFAGLARLDWTSDPRENRRILSDYLFVETENDPAARSDLAQRLDDVRRLVDKPGIEEIDRAFRSWTGTDAWMKHAIEGYLGGSPTSARAIFEQLRRGRGVGLKEAFLREWDMALNFCRRDDFREGVRARLIDKDRQPRWSPTKLADVEEEEIERLFSSDPGLPNALAEKIRAAQIEER